MLGEHSREVLAGLGYSASEIEAMLANGSVQETTRNGVAA